MILSARRRCAGLSRSISRLLLAEGEVDPRIEDVDLARAEPEPRGVLAHGDRGDLHQPLRLVPG